MMVLLCMGNLSVHLPRKQLSENSCNVMHVTFCIINSKKVRLRYSNISLQFCHMKHYSGWRKIDHQRRKPVPIHK